MGLRPTRPVGRRVPRIEGGGRHQRRGDRATAPRRGAATEVRGARGPPGAGPHGARSCAPRSHRAGPAGGREPAAHRAGALLRLHGLPAKTRGRTQISEQREHEASSGLNGSGIGSADGAGPDAMVAIAPHTPVDAAEHGDDGTVAIPSDLTTLEHELLADLFAIVAEHADEVASAVDRRAVMRAFLFACEHHADQRRQSGEDFITHPVGVARIGAGMRLHTATLCAALLHDTVEDTTASLDEVRKSFGEEIAGLVDGVTKLTGITFQSRDEAQAENYRKMMVAMATDIRVILIKLADRLHNMRTLGAMPKQKQIEKSKETLEIYAPLAHRLGI